MADEESESLRDFVIEAATTFPLDRARDLGALGARHLRGWNLCEIWSQRLSEGPYDSLSAAFLCLTTTGDLVESYVTCHEEDNHRLEYLRELSTDLGTFDFRYETRTRPSETFYRGEEGTLTVGSYSDEKVFTNRFDGLRAKVEDARRALEK